MIVTARNLQMIVTTRGPLACYEMSFTLDLDIDTVNVARGQNIIGQLGSHCLSHSAEHTLGEMEKPPQSHRPTEIPL